MFNVGDKFDLCVVDEFCEIIGINPSGQTNKETIYIVSFLGKKWR